MILRNLKLNRYLDGVDKRLLTMLNLFNFLILYNLHKYLNKHKSEDSYFFKRRSYFSSAEDFRINFHR